MDKVNLNLHPGKSKSKILCRGSPLSQHATRYRTLNKREPRNERRFYLVCDRHRSCPVGNSSCLSETWKSSQLVEKQDVRNCMFCSSFNFSICSKQLTFKLILHFPSLAGCELLCITIGWIVMMQFLKYLSVLYLRCLSYHPVVSQVKFLSISLIILGIATKNLSLSYRYINLLEDVSTTFQPFRKG